MASDNDGSYRVGFKRPPANTRFKKGKSGNPAGRKRGTEPLFARLNHALSKSITVTINGRRRKMQKRDAALEVFVKMLLAGDIQAMKTTARLRP